MALCSFDMIQAVGVITFREVSFPGRIAEGKGGEIPGQYILQILQRHPDFIGVTAVYVAIHPSLTVSLR